MNQEIKFFADSGKTRRFPGLLGSVLCSGQSGEGRAQSTLEFSFGLIAVVMLMLGMIRVFSWSARDMTDRRQAQEQVILEAVGDCPECPLLQTRRYFYESTDLGFGKNSNIFGNTPVQILVPPI